MPQTSKTFAIELSVKNEMIFCAFIILFYLCIDKYNLNKN